MPYQIIYSSQSATPMQTDDLEDILEGAREGNAEVGITGALVYVDGFFLQILEGKAKDLEELMGRIARDVRHERVTVLKQGEVSAAQFSNWHMAYVGATAEQVAEWAGYGRSTAMPDVVSELQSESVKVSRVAERILSVLLQP